MNKPGLITHTDNDNQPETELKKVKKTRSEKKVQEKTEQPKEQVELWHSLDFNIFQRLVLINKEIQPIEKTQKNEKQNFMYRGIDQVLVEIHDLFAKYGVLVKQEIVKESREERASRNGGINIYTIIDWKFTFVGLKGDEFSTISRGEAMDTGDKGSNKSVSIALKYALINTFTIPTEEASKNDPDKDSHEIVISLTKEEIKQISEAKTQEELQKICADMTKSKGGEYRQLIVDEYRKRKQDLSIDEELS